MNNTDIQIQRFKRSGADTLDLSNMNLTFIPTEVFALTNVVHLVLKDNRLISVDDRIGKLKNLEELDLENNNIKDLPSAFTKLKKLNVLNLSGNPLGFKFKELENVSGKEVQSKISDCFKNKGGDVFDDMWDDNSGGDDDGFDFDFDDKPKKASKSKAKVNDLKSKSEVFEYGKTSKAKIGGSSSSSGELKRLKKEIQELKEKNAALETKLFLGEGDLGAGEDKQDFSDKISLSEIDIKRKIS